MAGNDPPNRTLGAIDRASRAQTAHWIDNDVSCWFSVRANEPKGENAD